jgi:hypothetical protein
MNSPAELIVRQIAADRYPHGVVSKRCRYCSVASRDAHLPLCVWRQSREWLESVDDAARQAGARP